jgi:IS5 family transposase
MTANANAIEQTLAALAAQGRLEEVDAARVQALRSMAEALDAKPFNSQMWREYREALEGLTSDESDGGAIEALLDELRSPVRNPPAV